MIKFQDDKLQKIFNQEHDEDRGLDKVGKILFGKYKILSFPNDWRDKYIDYMKIRKIEFYEFLENESFGFIISGKLRPDLWKI